jgi:hypothetical protein
VKLTRVCLELTMPLLTVLLILVAGVAAGQDCIDQSLDRIDSKDFVLGILGPTSDSSGTKVFALDTPEVTCLVQHSDQAIPHMLQRFKASNGIHYGPSRIVYFIVFEKTKDFRAMLALADYLDSLPATEVKQAMPDLSDRLDPYEYALSAARAFGALAFLPQKYSTSDVFQARHQIAEQLRADFRRHSTANN